MKKISCFILIILMIMVINGREAFGFKFFDDRLEVIGNVQETLNIRTHQDDRNIRYSSFRTTLRYEVFLNMVKCPDLDVDFHLLGNYYWDQSLNIDASLKRSVSREAGRSHLKDVRRPHSSEVFLKELYFDIKRNKLQLRVGRQLVSWGETAEARVADLINPLELKYITAFPQWEDYKIGLWMARIFWTPENMWQDLGFEFLLIPGDFQELRFGLSGYPSGFPLSANNNNQKVTDKMYRDAPTWNIKNTEWGVRIKGFWRIAQGVDWTLSYFNTRSDSSVIASQARFFDLARIFLGGYPKGKVFSYPRYQSTAATFATVWERFKIDIRGECAYNTDVDYAYGSSLSSAYQTKERELITTALRFGRKFMIPFISNGMLKNTNRSVAMDMSWYHYNLFRYEDKGANRILWESGSPGSTWDKISYSASTGFLYDTIITQFNFLYDFKGPTTLTAVLAYQPGDRWQWSATYVQYNEQRIARYNNQVILSMKYEFF